MAARNKYNYDYIRVSVSPEEREFLEMLVSAGKARNAGTALHQLAFDSEDNNAQMHMVQKTAERIGAIHAELMRKLRTMPDDKEMYESDLIALDDKVMAMATEVSQMFSMLMQIGGIDCGNVVQHPDPDES